MPGRVATIVAIVLAVLAGSVARAQEPPVLDSQVVDQTGELDDREAIEDALRELQEDEGVQMFALFVETTGDTGMPAYADAVVQANNLGGSDALLVVALEDRTYQLWLGSLLTEEISQDEQDLILARELEPELVAGDYSGAVTATADAINEAASGTIDGDGGGGIPGGGLLLFLLVLGGGIALVLAAMWAWNAIKTSRQSRRTEEERDKRTGELARRANALLVETDEELRDARQELAFAEAEFPPADVEPFQRTLERARDELRAAFEIRQRLDDATPEDAAARERMLQEIVERCETAQRLLEEERIRLQQLRDFEQRAPETIERLRREATSVEDRIAPAEEALDRLQREYGDRSLQAVRGNTIEARKRVDFAIERVAAGEQALAAGDRRAAARAAQESERALAQAVTLLDGVSRLERSLQDARANLQQALAAAEDDVRDARGALTEEDAGEGAEVARAEAALSAAREELRREQPDYLAAYKAAVEASAMADAAVARVRDARERREKQAAVLDSALRSAEATYEQAEDYVRSRRRGIGRAARTRLAEAERHLDRARELRSRDPEQAVEEARSAQRLASAAYEAAAQDFEAYDSPRRGGISPGMIMLGGILLGQMGGGGFGGTRWGSPGRGGLGRGGIFGGAGRSMGGVFGGGRSRGGRW